MLTQFVASLKWSVETLSTRKKNQAVAVSSGAMKKHVKNWFWDVRALKGSWGTCIVLEMIE